ncbi:hypothetical protein OOJ91_30705 [Micromonospora lupini]|uniref:hypothetical protein n=1 Tax=Micromonospora lupini TaxID=285679 RepID=UPI00225BFC25|nr:hypothetical protein [Micromonospora lupini]MCX5070226.1 hypothetical protein [Micromonospora lupini]
MSEQVPEGVATVELTIVVEPELPLTPERLDALTQGFAEDLRALPRLRVASATAPVPGPGKSPEAWELGMLVVGGLFSATTMRAIVQIAVAYTERTRARSITVRSGEVEVVITGSTRIDDPLLVELARVIEAPHRSDPALASPEPDQAAIVPGQRPGDVRA